MGNNEIDLEKWKCGDRVVVRDRKLGFFGIKLWEFLNIRYYGEKLNKGWEGFCVR